MDMLKMCAHPPKKTEELRYYLDSVQNTSRVDFNYILELVESGADINTPDHQNVWTALNLCIYEASMDILKKLMRLKPDLGHKDIHGYTPLHHAVISNRTEVVKILLADGADIEAEDKSGQTPLMVAIDRLHIQSAEILLNHGANPLARNFLGSSPLDIAKDYGFTNGLALIRKHISLRNSKRLHNLMAQTSRRRRLPSTMPS